MDRLGRFAPMFVASLLIWLGVLMVDVVSHTEPMTNVAVFLAFLCMLALWLVWGLDQVGGGHYESHEKAKRDSDTEVRLALLLELLDEDERQALKRRLMDDLSGDGEAISLAQLLDAEQQAAGQRHT
jgi:hypothetical protein